MTAVAAAGLVLGGCGGGPVAQDSSPAGDAGAVGTRAGIAGVATGAVRPPPRVGKDLTVAQIAGQRIVASFRGPRPPRRLLRAIARGEVAGVVLFGDNATTVRQARQVSRALQRAAAEWRSQTPLFVMIDQEGGLIRRLRDAPPARSAAQLGAAGPGAARRAGRATGQELRRAGVNVNLAPVADLATRSGAIAAYERAFSAAPAAAGQRAAAFADGLRSARVLATAKHFPGLGRATANTDDASVVIRVPLPVLGRRDLVPFRQLAKRSDLVMLSSAVYPAIDPVRPAVLAPEGVRMARDSGFSGLVITDDLEATGLEAYGNPSEVSRRAATAGADLLMFAKRRPEIAFDAGRRLRSWLARSPRRLAEARLVAGRILVARQRLRDVGQG